MPQFSESSSRKLSECHSDIQVVFNEVIKFVDITVVWGHRGWADQTEAFETGNSKMEWPDSKHNSKPSLAIDICPYPVDWEDLNKFYYVAGIVLGIAYSLGVNLRWGGDWNSDNNLKGNKFNDLGHFELVE